jgi:hypothetical protein
MKRKKTFNQLVDSIFPSIAEAEYDFEPKNIPQKNTCFMCGVEIPLDHTYCTNCELERDELFRLIP